MGTPGSHRSAFGDDLCPQWSDTSAMVRLQEVTFLDQSRSWTVCPGERRTHVTFINIKSIKHHSYSFPRTAVTNCHKQGGSERQT